MRKISGMFFLVAVVSSNAYADFDAGLSAAKNDDYRSAIKEWQPLADSGNPAAQNNLGTLYAHGYGVPTDYSEAAKWYRLAADQGDRRAQSNLGAMYASGHGVPQDYGEAAKWYRLAAEQGDREARNHLGLMYTSGQGVPQDYYEAIKWYRLAADLGDAHAQYNLGYMYARGLGAQQNDKMAIKWYRLAAEQGNTAAQFNLGLMYAHGRGWPLGNKEAVKWYRLAAEHGDASAQYNLGHMYANGQGIAQDSAEAAKWIRLATEARKTQNQSKPEINYSVNSQVRPLTTSTTLVAAGGPNLKNGDPPVTVSAPLTVSIPSETQVIDTPTGSDTDAGSAISIPVAPIENSASERLLPPVQPRVDLTAQDELKTVAELRMEIKQAIERENALDREAKASDTIAKEKAAQAMQIAGAARKRTTQLKKGKIEVKSSDQIIAMSEAKKAQAQSLQAESEAAAYRASALRAQAHAYQAESNAKEAVISAKTARTESQRRTAKQEATEQHVVSDRDNGLARVLNQKSELKQMEATGKRSEQEQKQAEAELNKKREVQHQKVLKSFGSLEIASTSYADLAEIAAWRHDYMSETLAPALTILHRNPSVADVPTCGSDLNALCIPSQNAIKPQRPISNPLSPKVSFLPQIKRKIAVLIGINSYSDSRIPLLESALPDAQAVSNVLADKMGYEVRVLADATKAKIINTLNEIGRAVGPDDSVAIYYAGHGYLQDNTRIGFWIPSDASATSPKNWISNRDITRLLNNIPARQVILMSDSCYSGSLTEEQKMTASAVDANTILRKRSVTVMSSGGEEPVADDGKDGHSIFAWALMDTVKSAGKYDPGLKFYDTIRKDVIAEYPQVPQYGAAMSARHMLGADYLFEVRSYK
ncbi:MAG TPA: caspase family protein [Burkholderiaceae bacterium]|jgi:TPR repeat protein|nr:caspase family protein [Burkholderiaceae bacterium]